MVIQTVVRPRMLGAEMRLFFWRLYANSTIWWWISFQWQVNGLYTIYKFVNESRTNWQPRFVHFIPNKQVPNIYSLEVLAEVLYTDVIDSWQLYFECIVILQPKFNFGIQYIEHGYLLIIIHCIASLIPN